MWFLCIHILYYCYICCNLFSIFSYNYNEFNNLCNLVTSNRVYMYIINLLVHKLIHKFHHL